MTEQVDLEQMQREFDAHLCLILYEEEARAILAELRAARLARSQVPREPTEAMADAGESLYRTAPGTESRRGTPDPSEVWRVMYDVAIAGEQEGKHG